MPSRDPQPRGHVQPLKTPPTPWGRLRGSHGLSLRELEERSGISRGTLSRIEQALYPSPEQARQLLELYASMEQEGK